MQVQIIRPGNNEPVTNKDLIVFHYRTTSIASNKVIDTTEGAPPHRVRNFGRKEMIPGISQALQRMSKGS